MRPSDDDIEELVRLLSDEFKRDFTSGEAAEIAERLLAFVEAVHRASASSVAEPPSLGA